MSRAIAIGGLLTMVTATTAHAQAAHSFDDLPRLLTVGTRVEIVDTSGRTIPGRIADVTADSVTIRQAVGSTEQLRRDQVSVINKRRDSLKNGTFIGMGVGFLAGCATAAAAYDPNTFNIVDGPGSACLLQGVFTAGIGAGIGVAVDAIVGHGRVVYRASGHQVAFAPSISMTRTAAQVHWRW
jgi:hypothetical protein